MPKEQRARGKTHGDSVRERCVDAVWALVEALCVRVRVCARVRPNKQCGRHKIGKSSAVWMDFGSFVSKCV